MTKNKSSKKSNGNKLKSAIKNTPAIKANPLQYNGSYIKEDKVQRAALISIFPLIPNRVVTWFKSFIGQLIYAISENDFVGLIEVTNDEHCDKLEMMQFKGYRFTSIIGMVEKLELTNEQAGNDENKTAINPIENYRRKITSEKERISQEVQDNMRNSGMLTDIEPLLGELFLELFGSECDEEIDNYKRAIVEVLAHIANTANINNTTLAGNTGTVLNKLHEFFTNLQIYSKDMDAYLAYWNIHFHGSISDEDLSTIAKLYGVQ